MRVENQIGALREHIAGPLIFVVRGNPDARSIRTFNASLLQGGVSAGSHPSALKARSCASLILLIAKVMCGSDQI